MRQYNAAFRNRIACNVLYCTVHWVFALWATKNHIAMLTEGTSDLTISFDDSIAWNVFCSNKWVSFSQLELGYKLVNYSTFIAICL